MFSFINIECRIQNHKLEKKRLLDGAPDAIRTRDLRIRSPLLYPAELQARAKILLSKMFLIVYKNMFLAWNYFMLLFTKKIFIEFLFFLQPCFKRYLLDSFIMVWYFFLKFKLGIYIRFSRILFAFKIL